MLTFVLAWRNLFRNVRRTVLTAMLIGFSLTALILTAGAMLGMADVLIGGITHTLAGEVQVHKKGFLDNFDVDLTLDQPAQQFKAIESDQTVAGYAPRVITGAMIASTYNVSAGLVYGVDKDKELAVSRISEAIIQGQYLSGRDREILIGKPMAELLEVGLGDRIVVTASTVGNGEIAQELFRVSGVFEFGPREMDENIVFINLSNAQQFLAMGDKIHEIAIRFNQPEQGKNRDTPLLKMLNTDPVEAMVWLDFNRSVGSMMEMMNYSTLIVGSILFLLASLGLINSMFMSIYERIYEFGVLKAIGTTPGQIIKLVLYEALLLGIISCVLGGSLGYLLSHYFSIHGIPMGRMDVAGVVFDGNLYTILKLNQFLEFPIYVILLTIIAAIYPALFAARIVPSTALHRSL